MGVYYVLKDGSLQGPFSEAQVGAIDIKGSDKVLVDISNEITQQIPQNLSFEKPLTKFGGGALGGAVAMDQILPRTSHRFTYALMGALFVLLGAGFTWLITPKGINTEQEISSLRYQVDSLKLAYEVLQHNEQATMLKISGHGDVDTLPFSYIMPPDEKITGK